MARVERRWAFVAFLYANVANSLVAPAKGPFVMFFTLGFTPSNNASSSQPTELRGDDSEAVFGVSVITEEYHPIAGLGLLMRVHCVGK